jgi:hypothetical protein
VLGDDHWFIARNDGAPEPVRNLVDERSHVSCRDNFDPIIEEEVGRMCDVWRSDDDVIDPRQQERANCWGVTMSEIANENRRNEGMVLDHG